MKNWKLCYVEGGWAYFTTQELSEQWGDDWNDAPYEHNAGTPYEPCWHNHPRNINQEDGRGLNKETGEPFKPGEMCRDTCCINDWNDDGTPKWEIMVVGFKGGSLCSPSDNYGNSPYSVEMINGGAVPWLTNALYYPKNPVSIFAGVDIREFARLVHKAGGDVFLKLEEGQLLPGWLQASAHAPAPPDSERKAQEETQTGEARCKTHCINYDESKECCGRWHGPTKGNKGE